VLTPLPELDAVQSTLTEQFARGLVLWPRDRVELAGFGGGLDRVMQMPGWTNVWTMPIQNRVDMLSTGVNDGRRPRPGPETGRRGARLRGDRRGAQGRAGAADVIADPVRGKGYLEVFPDRREAAGQRGCRRGRRWWRSRWAAGW
jgi:Cu(I)/Ag(I) efflux system membrane protein CusA/SilA